MGEFDDFAAAASRSLADAQKNHDSRQQAAADARRLELQRQKICLEQGCLPTLSEAKVAFERQGLKVVVDNNWKSEPLYQNPEITFKMYGSKKRPHDETFYDVEGPIYIAVNCDSDNFTIKLVRKHYISSRADETIEAASDAELRNAIKLTASKLYEDLTPEGKSR